MGGLSKKIKKMISQDNKEFKDYIKLRIDNLRKLAKEKRELEKEEKRDIEKVAEEVFYNVEGDELPF